MNTQYVRLALGIIVFNSCIMCQAQFNYGMMPTNFHWHMLPASTNALTLHELSEQIHAPSNSVIVVQSFRDGTAWTTNMEDLWNGIWVEGTNGMRTQLIVVTNATNCLIRVQVGSFALKREPGSQCFGTPNGKFAKFELVDSGGNILPPKSTAGTNLLDDAGTFYRTNPPAWAEPVAGSLVADFPEKVSTNAWPLCYKGIGLAPIAHLSGHGIAEQISSINLYDLYSITNEGDYSLAVQPVLYMQKSHDDEFLDRVDLPTVTTKVRLVPNVNK